jgi:NADPH:quinone reductase-like Zn-dependent oxidoreductase
VRAAGVNRVDWKMRRGLWGGALPQQTGREVAGVVDEVGEGVTDVASGDRVFGFVAAGGGAAELALLSDYAPIPLPVDFGRAAGLPVAVETATLHARPVRRRRPHELNGAAGAVGSFALQIAVARGVRVIGTASPNNHHYPRSLSAAPTTYGDGLVERVRAPRPMAWTPPSTPQAAAPCPRS